MALHSAYDTSITDGYDGVSRKAIVRRRTRWILGLGLGIPVAVVGIGLLVLWILTPSVHTTLSSIETKSLPETWTDEASPIEEPGGDIEASASAETTPTIDTIGLPVSGTLVILGNGRPFGEESFTADVGDGDVVLRAQGKYWFKALIATISVSFDQTLTLDRRLRPRSMISTFDGPLGFGGAFQVLVDEAHATVHLKNEVREYDVADRVFVLGTFSTYAMIPLLDGLGELEDPTAFQTLVFGGPSNREDPDLPTMRVEKVADGTIRYDGTDLRVERYVISGDMGTMTLFAKGSEFLGLQAGGNQETLFVYRGDYFENGFEILDTDAPTAEENGEGG